MPRQPFTLTPEQRKIALEKAAEAKKAKTELLAGIRDGKMTLADILSPDAKEDERIQKLPVATLLRALPGVDPRKVAVIMEQAGIDESRRVRGLGPRQREALLAWRQH